MSTIDHDQHRARHLVAGLLDAINPAALLPDERDCCGTFPGTTHRSTCPQYRGKCKPATIAA